MSKLLSVKLDDDVFQAVEKSVHKSHLSRNAYINRAVRWFNRLQERRLLRDELRKESQLVREDSMAVLGEFENFQDEGL